LLRGVKYFFKFSTSDSLRAEKRIQTKSWAKFLIGCLLKNTRRNTIGNSYSTAPLFFNPMSHVGTNARQSSQCRRILVREEISVNKDREIKQRAAAEVKK
jgi:hypothetical protein